MDLISKHTQLRYLGYANTPVLWNDDNVLGLRQFKPLMQVAGSLGKNVPENLPLGKLVERFVTADLEKLNDIEILLENTQVQDGKLTIGELDCILKQNSIPIHLEIMYQSNTMWYSMSS